MSWNLKDDKKPRRETGGREFQAEGTAGAKAWGRAAGCVQDTGKGQSGQCAGAGRGPQGVIGGAGSYRACGAEEGAGPRAEGSGGMDTSVLDSFLLPISPQIYHPKASPLLIRSITASKPRSHTKQKTTFKMRGVGKR